jgi:hypothetical protein
VSGTSLEAIFIALAQEQQETIWEINFLIII